jgi:DNA (cytosine-5)-methyltransferase 1
MFCGAGGDSEGLRQACEDLDVEYELTAVNHNAKSIASHKRNHPRAKHLQRNVDLLKRRDLSASGRLDALWLSPACTHHSYARGGASLDYASRASAWVAVRETERYLPRLVVVENVVPFRKWGPVEPVFNKDGSPKFDSNGEQVVRPIKERQGATYDAWFAAMESIGQGYMGHQYIHDAASFGAPQTRPRLFTIFTAPGVEYVPPAPTHGDPNSPEVRSGRLLPYTPASSVVKTGIATKSIFLPVFGPRGDQYLSLGTLERISDGVMKLCSSDVASAFLVVMRRHATARSLGKVLPTILAGGTHLAVVEPRLTPLSDAFILGQHGGGVLRSISRPMSTVTTDGFVRIVESFMVKVNRGLSRGETPLSRVCSLNDVLDTVTTKNGTAVTDAVLEPARAMDDFRIVERNGEYLYFDMFLRMLDIPELAMSQGFGEDYIFEGGRGAQTMQIGNAVEVKTAKAVYMQVLRALDYAPQLRALAA